MKAVSLCTPLAAVLLLAACGGRDGAGTDGDSAQSASAQEALPRPDPEGGFTVHLVMPVQKNG